MIGITATSANVMKIRRKIGILLKNFIMTTSDPSQTTATHNEIAQANVPFCSVQELQKKWNTTMKVPPKSASGILLGCSRIAMSYSQVATGLMRSKKGRRKGDKAPLLW